MGKTKAPLYLNSCYPVNNEPTFSMPLTTEDLAGAKAVYEELKKRFPGPKRKSRGDDEAETEVEE
jgi:hypothetical protein